MSTKATTVSALKAHPVWYKIQVLVYDLRTSNSSKNRESEQRTLSTTDELYISRPYFTDEEAAMIKAATVDNNNEVIKSFEYELELPVNPSGANLSEPSPSGANPSEATAAQTVEEAIQSRLVNFFDKRKASGDARPCGPYDMAPVYQSVFGVLKAELENPRFISRLQRSGLAS